MSEQVKADTTKWFKRQGCHLDCSPEIVKLGSNELGLAEIQTGKTPTISQLHCTEEIKTLLPDDGDCAAKAAQTTMSAGCSGEQEKDNEMSPGVSVSGYRQLQMIMTHPKEKEFLCGTAPNVQCALLHFVLFFSDTLHLIYISG